MVTVVFQTDQAPQAAVHFHFNNNIQLLLAPIDQIHSAGVYRSSRPNKPRCSWDMERAWLHGEDREMERRGRLRVAQRMGTHAEWGQLLDCPTDNIFYGIDPH